MENSNLGNAFKARACITDIERYAVHDGPGIRTVVFFKGCPIRCLWCQNPETNHVYPEIMFRKDSCIGCMECVSACPEQAIAFGKTGFDFDRSKCIVCGKCADVCPTKAREISGKIMPFEKVLEDVLADKTFYENTGGGVTVSGGEPTMQTEFICDLFKCVKEKGIHTAMETCGYCESKEFRRAIEYCDMILFDIKHTDSDMHKKFTGVRTEWIMENLKTAQQMQKDIIIRIPLIPNVNDSDENLHRTAQIAKEVGAREIHILPFHQAGESKWDSLGREYECESWQLPEEELLKHAEDILKESGIIVNIGGHGNYSKSAVK